VSFDAEGFFMGMIKAHLIIQEKLPYSPLTLYLLSFPLPFLNGCFTVTALVKFTTGDRYV